MFNKKNFFIALCVMLTVLTGCDKKTVTPPEPVPAVDDFKIEVLETTTTGVSFRITPNDPEMRYVVMMTPKSNYDELGGDDECINDDLLWFESLIYQEGITAEEFYERELKRVLSRILRVT